MALVLLHLTSICLWILSQFHCSPATAFVHALSISQLQFPNISSPDFSHYIIVLTSYLNICTWFLHLYGKLNTALNSSFSLLHFPMSVLPSLWIPNFAKYHQLLLIFPVRNIRVFVSLYPKLLSNLFSVVCLLFHYINLFPA